MTRNTTLSRRHMMQVLGATGTVAVAGCLGGNGSDSPAEPSERETHDAYIVTYHWGFAAFDENGDEFDVLQLSPGDELNIHAVNDHAYDAFGELPDPVADELDDFDALARTQAKVEAGELPEPDGTTVEAAYEEAHGHSHEDDDHDHDDGHHDDDDDHDHDGGKLDHGFMLPDLDVTLNVPADASEPSTETVTIDEAGTYEALCTVPCGYYHEHQEERLIDAQT